MLLACCKLPLPRGDNAGHEVAILLSDLAEPSFSMVSSPLKMWDSSLQMIRRKQLIELVCMSFAHQLASAKRKTRVAAFPQARSIHFSRSGKAFLHRRDAFVRELAARDCCGDVHMMWILSNIRDLEVTQALSNIFPRPCHLGFAWPLSDRQIALIVYNFRSMHRASFTLIAVKNALDVTLRRYVKRPQLILVLLQLCRA